MHTLFLENEVQASEKDYGQCCSTELEFACENSANLKQETKTTKIGTYPLFPLASSYTVHEVFIDIYLGFEACIERNKAIKESGQFNTNFMLNY